MLAAPSPAVATGRHPRGPGAPPPPPPRRGGGPQGRAAHQCNPGIGVLVLSIAPARLYFEQTAEVARLERQAAALERTNQALSARADELRDDAFLERLARQCLGMVKPGEVAFVVVPKEGAPAPPPEC